MNLAQRFPVQADDRPALISAGDVVTYGELGERVGRMRGRFAAAGLAAGDRVLIVAGNSPSFVIAYLACLTGGLVAVPVNPVAPATELEGEVRASRPAGVVLDDLGRSVWPSIDTALSADIVDVPIALDDDADWAPGFDVDDDEPAVLLFTSGTAGTPRPAVLTHGNLASSLDAVLALGLPLADHDHVALALIPLFHVFGLNLVLNLGLAIGATFVLEDHQSPARTAWLVAEHHVTVMAGPPTFWSALLEAARSGVPGIDRAAMSSVEFAVSGAAPLAPTVAAAVEAELGVVIAEGYGLTETSGIVSSALGLPPAHGSVGVPFPGVEVRLVDDDGADVLIGDHGQVMVRGPMVSPGYFDDAETTRLTRSEDGWLATGDLAVVDEEGRLWIVDRLKDLIIVSGFNVHPAEIERVVGDLEGVEGVAVTAVSDSATGERPVAHVVVGSDASLDGDAVLEHCRARLARYKVPVSVEFVDVIPTGLGGKVRRVDLQR